MIILDTNVLSELMRPKPSPGVVAWVARQPAAELFTSGLSLPRSRNVCGANMVAKYTLMMDI